MASGRSMNRKLPKRVNPLEIDGLRDEQVMNATSWGLDEAPVYLRAGRMADDQQRSRVCFPTISILIGFPHGLW